MIVIHSISLEQHEKYCENILRHELWLEQHPQYKHANAMTVPVTNNLTLSQVYALTPSKLTTTVIGYEKKCESLLTLDLLVLGKATTDHSNPTYNAHGQLNSPPTLLANSKS